MGAQKALLLDLDGTLVATEELRLKATMRVLPEFGLAIDRVAYMANVHGGANDDIKRFLFCDRAETDGSQYVARKEAAFRDLLDAIPTVLSTLELLNLARRSGVQLAVVTNGPRANMKPLLAPLGGEAAFDAVVLGDELEHGKPHPLPYLTALCQLGVEPENACGFEFSASDITTSVAAGVFAIGIGFGEYFQTLKASGAREVVKYIEWTRLKRIDHLTQLIGWSQSGNPSPPYRTLLPPSTGIAWPVT